MAKNIQQNIIKWITLTVVISASFVVVVRLSLTWQWVLDLVADKVETIALGSYATTLNIGSLEGDLWKELQLQNVSINKGEQTIRLEDIHFSYRLPELIFGDLLIKEISLHGVELDLNADSLAAPSATGADNTTEQIATEAFSFEISQITIEDLSAHIQASEYLPDTSLTIDDLSLSASIRLGEKPELWLKDLQFKLREGRLPTPISFSVEGKLMDDTISLNNLLLETGKSVLSATAQSTLDGSEVNATLKTHPFALNDIQQFINRPMRNTELEMQLKIAGSIKQLSTTLLVNHTGLRNAEIKAVLNMGENPTINSLTINADLIDAGKFIPVQSNATVRNFSASLQGSIPIYNPEQVVASWQMSSGKIIYNTYTINQLIANGTLLPQLARATLAINTPNKENLTFDARLNNPFEEQPSWKLDLLMENVDLANWVGNNMVSTSLNLFAGLKGSGYKLPEHGWEYSISNTSPQSGSRMLNVIDSTSFAEIKLSGTVGSQLLIANGNLSLDESEIGFEIEMKELLGEALSYSFGLKALNLNMAEIHGLEDFPTSISGEIYGLGAGANVETGSLSGSLFLAESVLNGARLHEFSGDVRYQRGVLQITTGLLNSEIADAQISGQRNLFNDSDTDNRLDMRLTLKNLQPLAALLQRDSLRATGTLVGEVFKNKDNRLTGNFDLNLENVLVDTLFRATSITGTAHSVWEQSKSFSLDLNIADPEVMQLLIQDVNLRTDGRLTDSELLSHFNLEIIGTTPGSIIQEGTMRVNLADNITDFSFDVFDLVAPQSRMHLQQPFHLKIANRGFGTDTLKLESAEGALLELAIPFANESGQLVYLYGRNFNIGIIQQVVLGERIVDGVLSGDLFFHRTPENVIGRGFARLEQARYRGVEADTLRATYRIANERFSFEGSSFWDGKQQVSAWVNLPVIFDKGNLTDEFFGKEVRGELIVRPNEIARLSSWFNPSEAFTTSGLLSFHGTIRGTAGAPIFNGSGKIDQPIFSGRPFQQAIATFEYDNKQHNLLVEGELFKNNATIAELDLQYPLYYDFRNFELNLAGNNDIINARVSSNNLDLALFNDFLPHEYVTNLGGILNANIQLSGTLGNITPKGQINFSNGRVSMPVTGITMRNMSAIISANESVLNVEQIRAQSGPGEITANGTVALNGIIPTNIQLSTRARQFQMANSPDMQLIVDMDADLLGRAMQPQMVGDITIRNGYYYVVDFGEDLIEDVQLEEDFLTGFAPFDSLSLEMVLNFGNSFFVRNRSYLDAEIKLNGTLDIVKSSGSDAELFGELTSNTGYIRPLGKRFNIQDARFLFTGPYNNPDLAIKSTYIPQTRQKGESVILYYVVSGTADEPVFAFESDPIMEQQDVICYTLFNKPCYSLDSWQSVFAGDGSPRAVDVLTDVILDQVGSLATRQLGVDLVQIDNSGQNGATAIKTGWYLNERTFFSIINELTNSTPKTLFVLEYILNENWDFIVTQGDNDRQGVDLRYQYDY